MSQQLAVLASAVGSGVRSACGFVLIFAAAASTALAGGGGPPPAPEMNPAAVVSAVALLSGGFLILTDRLFRKRGSLVSATGGSAQTESIAQ